jgi:hypothetical protein
MMLVPSTHAVISDRPSRMATSEKSSTAHFEGQDMPTTLACSCQHPAPHVFTVRAEAYRYDTTFHRRWSVSQRTRAFNATGKGMSCNRVRVQEHALHEFLNQRRLHLSAHIGTSRLVLPRRKISIPDTLTSFTPMRAGNVKRQADTGTQNCKQHILQLTSTPGHNRRRQHPAGSQKLCIPSTSFHHCFLINPPDLHVVFLLFDTQLIKYL